MTTDPPLLPLFTEAFLAEQKRYCEPYKAAGLEEWRTQHEGDFGLTTTFFGTRADCERFVVERCARKGFEAMWKLYAAGGPINTVEALFCQRFLATEPEPTSGDENAS